MFIVYRCLDFREINSNCVQYLAAKQAIDVSHRRRAFLQSKPYA